MSLNLDKTGWKRVSLGEVARASKDKVDPLDGTVERFVAGEHMDTDDLKIHTWGVTSEVALGPAFHRRFRLGQVLYGSRRTYLRKVAVADFDGVCANTTFVVETKDENVLLQEFLPFVMTAEPFHAFAIAESKGSVNPYVNWSDIERYDFDLPPLDEQKRVAELLWAIELHRLSLIDEAASSRRTAGVLMESLRSSARLVALASVATIRSGQTFPKRFQGNTAGDIPFFKVSDLDTPGNERWLTNPASWITKEEASELGARPFQPGTIVTARVGAALRLERRRMLKTPALVDDNHLVISPTETDSVFLWAVLNETRLSDTRNDGVVPSLNQRIVGAVPVPDLQRNRAEEVGNRYMQAQEAADASIAEEVALRTLRSALLAEVFGGN